MCGKLVKMKAKISLRYNISATNGPRKHCSSQHCSLKILSIITLSIGNTSTIHLGTIHQQACVYILFFHHSTSTLQHAIIFLKFKINEHIFMNLVSLSKNSNLE